MSVNKIIAIFLFSIAMPVFAQEHVTDYVNPFVGTKSMGHTFPGACAPFGLVQLSPDTEMVPHNIDGQYQKDAYRYCAGYQYDDPTIIGFSHTHFNGTGHSDLGDILLMPTTGEVQLSMGTGENPETGYRSRFSHETEQASPGYYSVILADYGIKAELTASPRVGVHKYTYPKGEGHVIMDLSYGIYNYDGKVLMANLRVEDPYTLTGYRITKGWSRMNYTHFAVKFSKPIKNYGCKDEAKSLYTGWWRKFDMKDNFPEMFGTKLTAFFNFDFEEGEDLLIKVAFSPVDCLGALANLNAEVGEKSFEEVKKTTENLWEKEMSVVRVDGTKDQKSVFYTALYRTMINPSVYQDVDGRYRGIDHNIHQATAPSVNYTVFSLWDTFRAQHPLMNLLFPEKSSHFISSMLNHYQQSAHKALPIWSHMGNENWCMIGYHAVSVMSDAAAKGIKMDIDQALQACISSSNLTYYDGIGDYLKLGYVPVEANGSSASVTVEYAYDDWAIYRLAERIQKNDIATSYAERALNYRKVFDPALGFVRPKCQDGTFKKNFDLLDTHNQGFIEGNSWNYSFFVPHDVSGLIEQMGGEKRFVQRVDSLFSMELPKKYFENTEDITEEGLIGNYVHGNEPSHHIPYLYMWTSQPWKTQSCVRNIMNRMYKNKADGLCGNDDCGQMSAWYVFSSLGFYPVCPGSDQYVLGSPNVRQASIRLGNEKQFSVRTENDKPENVYVKSVKLNGKTYNKAYITHGDIMNGGELVFEMAAKPNKNRIFSLAEKPYSLTD